MQHKNIFVCGPSATGKSSLSRSIASTIGFLWMDTGSLIRMTAYNMEQNGISLPNAENPHPLYIPDWNIVDIKGNEIAVQIGQDEIVDYDNPELRNPAYDTNTLFLAKFLNPRIETIQEEAAALGDSIISCRHAPSSLFAKDSTLNLYISVPEEERIRRRLKYEDSSDVADITQRIVDKEKENVALGNLVSDEKAENEGYVFVYNSGSIESSLRNVMAEIVIHYGGLPTEQSAEISQRLSEIPPTLWNKGNWDRLFNELSYPSHPEGPQYMRS